jgi:hypothetical protein
MRVEKLTFPVDASGLNFWIANRKELFLQAVALILLIFIT